MEQEQSSGEPKSPSENTIDPVVQAAQDKLLEIRRRQGLKEDGTRIKTFELAPLEYMTCPRPGCGAEVTMLTVRGICSDCDEKETAERERKARMKERIEQILGPKGIAEFDLHRFRVMPGTEAAYEAAQNFNPDLFNLYIHGPCGTGKSHLGFGIVKKFLESGRNAMVYKTTDLMRMFRKKEADDEAALLRRIAKHEVLLIDDLGVGRATEYANQILYEIIDIRLMNYRNGLIITSNLSLGEFAEKIADDRIPSRLKGLCQVVKIESERDFRVGN